MDSMKKNKITIGCEVCQKDFEIKKSEVGRRFCCSTKCGYSRLTKYKYGDSYKLNKEGASRKDNQANLRKRYRIAVLEELGSQCIKCGFKDIRALQIDHIHGGGKEERRAIPNTNEFYQKVIDSYKKKENIYQILCANCNVIKRIVNKEHKIS